MYQKREGLLSKAPMSSLVVELLLFAAVVKLCLAPPGFGSGGSGDTDLGSGLDDSEIPFSPLPSVPEPASSLENLSTGSSLQAYYDLASIIVNTVRPGRLPHGS